MKQNIVFLTLAILMSSYSLPIFCAAYDAKIDGVYYNFDYANNTATVTRYRDDCNFHVSYPDSVVYIPSKVTYEGKEFIVNRVDGCTFRDSYMKRVIMPNTIQSIGGSAFFLSKIETCIIPAGTQYVGNSILWDCSEIKYIEIGEDVISIGNLGSKYQSANGRSFKNLITVKWNAINCQDFERGKINYGPGINSEYYPDGTTPFWKGDDDYEHRTETHGFRIEDIYEVPDPIYIMKHYITKFIFGQKVEHIPAYLCYKLSIEGAITIPRSVKTIGELAFGSCDYITSVTIDALVPPSGNGGLWTRIPIYVPCQSFDLYKASPDWSKYDIRISPYTYEPNATSSRVIVGCDSSDIYSVGILDGDTYIGNTIEFIGLDPNSDYRDIPIVQTSNSRESDTLNVSFSTTALELTTQPSKPVSATTAILLAETNMSDAEVSCGFEWKRNDAPEDMAPNKIYCPVASGQMAGRLKGLKDDVYYKYRAFYQSAAGNMYYGDWQYIFTGDVAVEFDPILYTYGATVVRENEATISGYALAGSEDFTEQGFEYWAESRTNGGANAPRHMTAALGEHKYVQASGISLRVTLTNLDAGTVYKYRVYGKVGDQYYCGSEQAFTTTGTYTPPTYTITFVNWDGSELQSSQVTEDEMPEYIGETPERPADEQYTYTFIGWSPVLATATADATYTATYEANSREGVDNIYLDSQVQKFFRDGQILILRGDKTFTLQGQEIK